MTPATCAVPVSGESTTARPLATIAARWPHAVPCTLPDGRAYWCVLPDDEALLRAAQDIALLSPLEK